MSGISSVRHSTSLTAYTVRMNADTATHKRRLRARTRQARSALSEAELLAARDKLTARLQALVQQHDARSVSCFLPVRGEPDTTQFIDWALASGIDVLLPCSRPDGLIDWVRPNGDGTVTGAFGVPEPVGEVLGPLGADGIDLMLIPAAAVDTRGSRLGWGRGYFDRNLASLAHRPPVFAVVYESEVLDQLPIEPHDVPLQGVVTPERTLRF